MGFFDSQNPGIGGINIFTSAEITILQQLGDLTYSNGDILYYNNGFKRLAIGSDTNVLTISGGLPAWGASAGGGDFSSNTSTSVDSEIVLFSGTAGKTGKRATGTGVAYITSGVLSTSKVTLTQPATGSTLTIVDGKTLTVSNTLTFTGTDSSSVAFGSGGTVAYTANNLSVFASTTSAQLAGVISDETGSGALVFGTTPTLATPVINGTITGTGQDTAATASTIMMRDSNVNTNINNIFEGFTTTATAAGTTTLTVASTYTQIFTGSTTQTVKLPTTSVPAGAIYTIINQSSGAVTVQSSGANTIVILAANTSATFTAVVATPTTAANWNAQYFGMVITSGKSLSVNNTITLAGTDSTTMTFPSTSATIARTDAGQTFTGVQVFTSPKIITQISDTNGNILINIGATASAVNYVKITNAATGTAGPIVSADGETNVDLKVAAKGTGKVHSTSGTYGDITAYSPSAASTATLTLNTSNIHSITMPAGNITIALSNEGVGQCFIIRILQDGTGSRTVTWFTTIKWAGGSAPTLTTTASKADVFGFIVTSAGNYDGFVIGQNL